MVMTEAGRVAGEPDAEREPCPAVGTSNGGERTLDGRKPGGAGSGWVISPCVFGGGMVC